MSALSATFGQFGGRYVAETLMPALEELERAYESARQDPAFEAERLGLARSDLGQAANSPAQAVDSARALVAELRAACAR